MRIAVHGRQMADSNVPMVARLLERMPIHGMVPVPSPALAEWLRSVQHALPSDMEVADPTSDTDMLISLGGDGSLLDSVALVASHGVPVLGINMGRLGFLSNVRQEDMDKALSLLAKREFDLEERSLLSLAYEGNDAAMSWPHALNEVSVHKRDTYTMVAVHAYLDGRFLNTYWSDGLIVATPTGSTAYSLSCGGPLLDPRCRSLVITPIAPHNLNVRPFVVPDDVEITLVVEARGDKYLVNRDSRSTTLSEAVPLIIRRAPFTAKLVQLEGTGFLETLRTKLNWGLDARSEPPKLEDKA